MKNYTEEDLINAFQTGFENGFGQGKTRNIITHHYYNDKFNEATIVFKNELKETK